MQLGVHMYRRNVGMDDRLSRVSRTIPIDGGSG